MFMLCLTLSCRQYTKLMLFVLFHMYTCMEFLLLPAIKMKEAFFKETSLRWKFDNLHNTLYILRSTHLSLFSYSVLALKVNCQSMTQIYKQPNEQFRSRVFIYDILSFRAA